MKYFISILLFSLFVFFNQTAIAKDNPQAMIVFDASGSMWGQVDGKAKITIAKQALNKVVSNWNENTHLGLIAYGHRRKGDCNDIQTLVPIGKVNKSGMISTVKKIKPKGKTPISRSIKKAADALRYTEEKATVILISDGKETCDADPCATAKALEEEGIDFVAHVIGFNVDKQTDAQLKCVAEATGGEYFSAKNADALNDAMTQIVKKVEKTEPKPPVVKKLKNNLQLTATESEGGKWVDKARHFIYPLIDGEKQEDDYTQCHSYKKEACLLKFPAGKYVVESTYNKFKQKTNFEITAGQLTKVNVIMGQTGKVQISASESEGSKWIDEARHFIYHIIDGEKQEDDYTQCHSYKKEACLEQLPIGKYVVESTYNKFKQKTNFEISAGQLTKVNVIMGQTGKVEISTSESEGSKWVDNARHFIYPLIDGEKQEDDYTQCHSYKKEACLVQLPVAKYIIESTYNKLKQKTHFEITAGELTKVNVVMGQTAKVEISASETEGGKWIKAYHRFYAFIDGELQDRQIDYCNSYKKEPCIKQLPVGKYSIHSTFNKFKQDTIFEVKSGEVTKIHVVMGQTGKVEISASESEGGKWIKAYHRFYAFIDGELQDRQIDYCNSFKKEACIKQLPVGKYSIHSTFNKFKQDTIFEIKSGGVAKVHVVMGQTGKVEISASESEGGKWIKAYHRFYAFIDGELQDRQIDYCNSFKKEACIKQLPVGKYSIHSTFNKFKQDTLFEIKAGEKTQLHLNFAPFHLSVKGTDSNLNIIHEVISSTGRVIADAKTKAKDGVDFVLPAGKYTIESTANNVTKKTKIIIGGDNPTKNATVDFTAKQEESHEDLIKADSSEQKQEITPAPKPDLSTQPGNKAHADKPKTDQATSKETDKIDIDTNLIAFKQSIIVSLPILNKAKDCYKKADALDEANACDQIQQTAMNKARETIQKISGKSLKEISLDKQSEWNSDIKTKVLDELEKSTTKMQLSIECFEKGTSLSELLKCIANKGKFK